MQKLFASKSTPDATNKSADSAHAYQVATFYLFSPLERVAELRARVEDLGQRYQLLGTVLLAAEGVNATVCAETKMLSAWEAAMRQLCPAFAQIDFRHTWAATPPFRRWRVKLRPEIVTLGVADIDPIQRTGEHVTPERWNQLIQRQDVRVVDTRNHYEFQLGSFTRAEDPLTDNFREFPDWVAQHLDPAKDEHVAMFCTGGIRCEKASAYLLQRGFKHVYQLQGGILEYLRETPQQQSLWRGECFVFDDRVTLDHAMQATGRLVCCACRKPFECDLPQTTDRSRVDTETTGNEGICTVCLASMSERQLAGVRERMRQVRLAKQRGEDHLAPQVVEGEEAMDEASKD